MSGFIGVNLRDILTDDELGEKVAKKLISSFSCPQNIDVEYFLEHNAIEFTKQGIANTFLVLASYKGEYVLVGYFALANKFITVDATSFSKKWKSRIARFGQYDSNIKRYVLSAPLIGQLGKNFAYSDKKLITGDELITIAFNKIKEMQNIVGGKFLYIECEQKEFLISFYERHGFVNFGTRPLDRDETDKLSGESLVQMLKYMD